MKKIPIGVDDFKNLIEDDYYFIDKFTFIKEFWEDSKTILITLEGINDSCSFFR